MASTPVTINPERILRRVSDGFELLANLHETLGREGGSMSAEAQEHINRATRELAAVQRLYERRG